MEDGRLVFDLKSSSEEAGDGWDHQRSAHVGAARVAGPPGQPRCGRWKAAADVAIMSVDQIGSKHKKTTQELFFLTVFALRRQLV